MSIEDLMNIEITSASRKEQRAADVAAAVFVITHDDIRRSGMTTIPDLLRLAPGVQVAQINSNKWAVSVRGFNGLYANKLLVLVDGRSVYNRIFSGVLWDAEDLMLDDIDRIEVIRGPGAAHVGRERRQRRDQHRHQEPRPRRRAASSASTPGAAGTQGAVRYGGTHRRGALPRVLRSGPAGMNRSSPPARAPTMRRTARRRDSAPTGPRGLARSRWRAPSRRARRARSGPTSTRRRPRANRSPTIPPTRRAAISSAAGRTRAPAARRCRSSRSSTSRAGRSRWGTTTDSAFDVDTQYHTALGARHDLVAGAGYRFIGEQLRRDTSACR